MSLLVDWLNGRLLLLTIDVLSLVDLSLVCEVDLPCGVRDSKLLALSAHLRGELSEEVVGFEVREELMSASLLTLKLL